MALTKVLIAVKTYPSISKKYDELVCTAGFLEDGSWIRLYPIQFRKKSYDDFWKTKDLYFYLGTTHVHHYVSHNPFIIIGTFYPKKKVQLKLF